jgi:hypothetical protein
VSATLTYTATTTPLPATSTPEYTVSPTPIPAATPDKFELEDPLVYPNPYNFTNNIMFGYFATQACSSVTLKIYTRSFRLIIKDDLGACPQGRVIKPVAAEIFGRLGNGIYYYVITAKNSYGKAAVSKLGEIIILR